MKILVDESIPSMTISALRAAGHDVLDLRQAGGAPMEDERLWEKAQEEGRLIITPDKGFVGQRDAEHHGILIARLRQPNRKKIHERILRAVAQFPEAEWPGLLVVVRDTVMSVARSGK